MLKMEHRSFTLLEVRVLNSIVYLWLAFEITKEIITQFYFMLSYFVCSLLRMNKGRYIKKEMIYKLGLKKIK